MQARKDGKDMVDKGWEQMRNLLDQELPEDKPIAMLLLENEEKGDDKKRRRWLFFILLFLCGALFGGYQFYIQNSSTGRPVEEPIAVVEKEKGISTTIEESLTKPTVSEEKKIEGVTIEAIPSKTKNPTKNLSSIPSSATVMDEVNNRENAAIVVTTNEETNGTTFQMTEAIVEGERGDDIEDFVIEEAIGNIVNPENTFVDVIEEQEEKIGAEEMVFRPEKLVIDEQVKYNKTLVEAVPIDVLQPQILPVKEEIIKPLSLKNRSKLSLSAVASVWNVNNGMSIGIEANYPLARRWSLSGGIHYVGFGENRNLSGERIVITETTEEVPDEPIIETSNVDTMSNTRIVTVIDTQYVAITVKKKYQERYLNFPLQLNYKISPKMDVFFGGELSYFLSNQYTEPSSSTKDFDAMAFDSLNSISLMDTSLPIAPRINWGLNAGASYQLLRKLDVSVSWHYYKDNQEDVFLKNSLFSMGLKYKIFD